MRRKVIAGNWKMNMLPNEAINFIENLKEVIENIETEVILCVPYIDLFYALLTAQNTKIKIGAQNMHWEEKGAYTGEISGKMLECLGVEYVIIGHSERRQYFAETDEIINKKLKLALLNNLKPILCVGENLEIRKSGKYKEFIINQIKQDLVNITSEEIKEIIIAYEPIWAIGTGQTATNIQANEVIKCIREELRNMFGKKVANDIIIQYGGSVKPTNAEELFNMSDIDGALVGGASLNIEEFKKICRLLIN